jgi:hypothetical protein
MIQRAWVTTWGLTPKIPSSVFLEFDVMERVRMSRITTLLLLAAFGLAPASISAQQPAAPPSHNEVLSKNAVMTTAFVLPSFEISFRPR